MDFEKAYLRYFQVIYRYLLSLSGDAHLAEEIAQETFLRAMKAVDSFQGQSAPETWLCSIAKNCYIDHCRRQKRMQPGEMPDLPDGTSLEDKLVDKDTALSIHKALHTMAEPYKEVFTLRVFGELSYAHIGELFDKSESWGRVTYYRAKQKLKEAMKQEEPNGYDTV